MKTSFINFLITLLASLLIFGIAAYFIVGFVNETLADSIEGTPPVSFEIVTEAPRNQSTSAGNEELPELHGESFTYAIIGTDYQPETLLDYNIEDEFEDTFPKRRNRTYSADTIIIVRADIDSRTLLLTSIPSNLRFEVDGSMTTLGKSYYDKGLDFFLGKLSALTGFQIDKYFVIDVENFAPIFDAIGTVSFNVPEKMEYSDPEQKLEIKLEKGKQVIDGEKAVQLLRYNDYENSNNSRSKTTLDFLMTVADKFNESSFIDKVSSAFKLVLEEEYITTNCELDELAEPLKLIADYEHLEKVTSMYPGTYISDRGTKVFKPDIQSAVKQYAKFR